MTKGMFFMFGSRDLYGIKGDVFLIIKSLNDLVLLMLSVERWYIDPLSMSVYNQHQFDFQPLPDTLIAIPSADLICIIKSYVDSLKYGINTSSYRALKAMCENNNMTNNDKSDLIRIFHLYVNDNDIELNWLEYRDNYLYKFVNAWCKDNKIYF